MKYIALCLILVLTACSLSGGTARTRYLIDPQAVIPPAATGFAKSGVVRVAIPVAEFGLDTDRIQVQTADGHIVNIQNAVWVEPLGEMLQPLLIHSLEHSGRFTAVVDDESAASATIALQTNIERFTLVYGNDSQPPHVEVALRMQVTRLQGDQLLTSKRLVASAPVETVRMSTVVPAFEASLAQCLQQLTKNTVQAVRIAPQASADKPKEQ